MILQMFLVSLNRPKTNSILGRGFSDSMTVPYKVQGDGYIRLKLTTLSPVSPLTRVAYTNPIFISTKGASLDMKYPPSIGGEFVTLDPFNNSTPDVDKNIVVWRTVYESGGNGDIYMKNLSTGVEESLL